jgi:hypothetical protein
VKLWLRSCIVAGLGVNVPEFSAMIIGFLLAAAPAYAQTGALVLALAVHLVLGEGCLAAIGDAVAPVRY